MRIIRKGSVTWQGGIKDGSGAISTASGALKNHPYGFASRFEGVPGSNPEELIAAAHASCFTMTLSLILDEAKLTAKKLETTAEVVLESVSDGFAITSVNLMVTGCVPNVNQAVFECLAAKALFESLATKAKGRCTVSKLLKAEISLVAMLVP